MHLIRDARANCDSPAQEFSLVKPLAVFAAGRQSFDAIVGIDGSENTIKALIFDELSLENYGWNLQTARVRKLFVNVRGETVWNVSRGDVRQ